MAKVKNLDDLVSQAQAGDAHPVYLIQGDLVVAEPQAARLAEALAEKAGCPVERYRRPATLAPILADLKTYSLFATAKVVLVLDSAILADTKGAAELIDQAGEALPLAEGADADNDPAVREAASRLLQVLRVFAIGPSVGSAEEIIDSLPKWALKGGSKYRKKHPRGRPAKEVKALRKGLIGLTDAALAAGLQGFAEGDLAELGTILANGLPPNHTLILAEPSVDREHPLLASLRGMGAAIQLGQVSASKGGNWQGLEPIIEELSKECGVTIQAAAVAELAKRTLRETGDFRNKRTDEGSTSRFAGEFRKLAGLARGGQISRQLVVQSVEDRGEQDVWKILDAIGQGNGAESLALLKRFLNAADDTVGARLSFFAVLVRFCRQLVAVAGFAQLLNIPAGLRDYNRFKDRWAGALQGDPPHGGVNPLAGTHPFQLFRAYQTASGASPDALARLPAQVLETELRLKGDSSDPDAALFQLVGQIVKLVKR